MSKKREESAPSNSKVVRVRTRSGQPRRVRLLVKRTASKHDAELLAQRPAQ